MLGALGQTRERVDIVDGLRERWDAVGDLDDASLRRRGFELLEAGKAYQRIGDGVTVRAFWSEPARILEQFEEHEHVYRAQSNVAFLDLHASPRTYAESCGRADHQPVELPFHFAGISEDATRIHAELAGSGGKSAFRLDSLLRPLCRWISEDHIPRPEVV